MSESFSRGKDTRTDRAIHGYLISENRTGYSIHYEPDVGFGTTYFNVSFIGKQRIRSFVIVVIYKRFYYSSGSSCIVGNLLVREFDSIKVIHGLGGFAKRKLKVDVKSQVQRHDVSIILGEFQRGSIWGEENLNPCEKNSQ